MRIRASEVAAEGASWPEEVVSKDEPDPFTAVTGRGSWSECEFEGCSNPTSFARKDRFGIKHRSCTDCQDVLDLWIRIHNGWETDDGALDS